MRIPRFLAIIEVIFEMNQKVIIVLIILCFIPICLQVFLPSQVKIPENVEKGYASIKAQLSGGFMIGINKNLTNFCSTITNMLLYNSICMSRCNLGSNCQVVKSTSPCNLSYPYFYVINDTTFCTSEPIVNDILGNNSINALLFTNGSLQHNDSNPPLFSIQINPNSNNAINQTPYCLNYQLQPCKNLMQFFGESLSGQTSNIFNSVMGMRYLMYFALMPLIGHAILMLILDQFSKCNLRMTNSLLMVHVCIVEIAIIVVGLQFDSEYGTALSNIKSIGNTCLLNTSSCSSLVASFNGFNEDPPFPNAFKYFLQSLIALQILGIIGIIIVNVLMNRYYKLRDIDPSSSGYELQIL